MTIFQIIVDVLSPIVSTCVFNQYEGHWLLNDVLNSTKSICLKWKKEFEIFVSFDNFIEEVSIVTFELGYLAPNIKFFFVSF